MTTCVICRQYYRLNQWHNSSSTCQNCIDSSATDIELANKLSPDSEYELDKAALVNPSGRTKPVFYNDYYTDDLEDSHGF